MLAKLKDTNTEYSNNLKKAKEETLRDFDKVIAKTKTMKGITEAARKDKLKDLNTAKDKFSQTAAFPMEDEYAFLELDYYLGVHKAYLPTAKLIEEAFKKANMSNDEKLLAEATALKENMEKILPGKQRLEANTKWFGTLRRNNGNTIPYHLAIHKKGDAGTIRGHVEDNPGVQGNWAYDIEGQTVGLAVEFALSKNLRGNLTAVKVLGIVSGDRFIARIVQVAGKGKPSEGLLVLKLQKK